jgi:hypothetical protein
VTLLTEDVLKYVERTTMGDLKAGDLYLTLRYDTQSKSWQPDPHTLSLVISVRDKPERKLDTAVWVTSLAPSHESVGARLPIEYVYNRDTAIFIVRKEKMTEEQT